MKTRLWMCRAACAALLAGSMPIAAQAHHSATASFDFDREVEVVGEVVEWRFRNPHSLLVVNGVAGGEDAALWEIEMSSAAGLRRRGVDSESFKPGDQVTLKGYLHREPGVHRALVLGGPTGAAPPPALPEAPVVGRSGVDALAGVWGPPRLEPALPDTPLKLTPPGRAAWEGYDQTLSPANTCEPMSIPDLFNAPYMVKIELSEGQAIVRNEIYDVARTVPLGAAGPADPDGWFGTVSGRIDGETLVVESRDYPASRWGLASAVQFMGSGADAPSSEQKTVVERFSVSEDGRTLTYEFTVEDPVYLDEPFSHSIEYARRPDETPIYPYDCLLDSASQFSRD